jgi:hypothetical protein
MLLKGRSHNPSYTWLVVGNENANRSIDLANRGEAGYRHGLRLYQ